MPCQIPYRDDSAQTLLFKIASCLADGSFISGVSSFNTRTGAVTLTSGDVTSALGFTPISQANGDARYVLKTGDTMSGLLSISTAATSLQTITSDAGAANTPETIQIFHRTSAVPATGFGNRLQFYANTNGGTDQLQTRIDSQWVDAADATRSSRLVFGTRNTGGVISSPLILTNGQLQLLDGLATIPSLSFQSDTDTGIYRVGADSVGVSTGGTLRFTVASAAITSTVPIDHPDGTAAAPSLTFTSDMDTGLYRIGANSFGSSAGGTVILATSTTGINLTTALAYQYNSVNVIRAQTALNNYFFGPSGNLTMTGVNNTSVGFNAFISNTTGTLNVAVGNLALNANTTGDNNTALGYQALGANTTGIRNTAIGFQALSLNTSGDSNVAIGYLALGSNTTGANNVANGYQALGSNTTGTLNVAVGIQALFSNTTGNNQTASGYQALFANTTGTNNTGSGFSTLTSNTTGSSNTAFGYRSLGSNTTASFNTAFGLQALFSTTTSPGNTAVGFLSLFDVTASATGQNTAIGYNTGRGITTGSNNTIVGANIAGLAAALSNNIILADGAGVIRLQIDSSGNTTLAGTVAIAAGTAALPAFTFSADLNTGLYNIGADSVGLSTGGTLRTTTNTTDLILATGFRLAMASGANQRAGNAVLVAGTVTVANTSVTANTIVLLTRKTAGGTLGTAITYTTIAATSFTIDSDSVIDTSTFSYLLIEVP